MGVSKNKDISAIEVDNLSAGYGKENILHDISFRIPEGASCTLMGPNGCGKTTLLRALTGVIPYSGSIRILGRNLRDMKRDEIASCMAMMSQLGSVYFSFTVRETVSMGRYARHKMGSSSALDREAVDRCLERTGLCDIAGRQISALSGGQLQRVFLARTLAQETPVILLDEPANHLDMKYQSELMDYLKKWSREETVLPDGRRIHNTLIGVFHDLTLAVQNADDMVFLKDGHLVLSGAADDILSGALLQEVYDMDVSAYVRKRMECWEKIVKKSNSVNSR